MFNRASPHHAWYVLGLTLVNQAFTVGIIIYSFALFVVPWLERFDISRGEVMVSIVLLQLAGGFISPLLGRLLDVYSIRLLVTGGGLAMGFSLLLLALSSAFWHINLVFATLLPLGMALAGTLSAQTLIARWFHKNRGMAIGISSMGTSMGGFLFPPITAGLLEAFGWENTLAILGVVTLVVLVPLNFLVLRVAPPDAPKAATETAGESGRLTTAQILGRATFWLPVLGMIPVNAAFGGVQFNLGAYVSDLGFEQQVAAQLISTTALTMIFGKLMFGWAGDRFDHRYLYWLMTLLLACSLSLYQGSPSRHELMLAATLQGLAMGGVLPLIGIMYAARFGTLAFGRVLGLVYLFLVAGSFGPLLAGWLFDLTGSYDWSFLTFVALLVPVSVSMFWLPAPEAPKPPEPSEPSESAAAAPAGQDS